MMNYEIFKEVVKEKFMDYMPDNFKGMELVVMPVEKVNMTYDGISIRGKDTNISPTIYINDMYEKYQNCGDLEETLMRHVTLWQWSLQRHHKLLMLTAYTKMPMKR